MKHSFLAAASSVAEGSPPVAGHLASISSWRRLGTEAALGCKTSIRVLLVGEEPQEFFVSRRFFERSDCQSHFAKSEPEIAELLIANEFDIVLSTYRISGGSIHRLIALLSGSRASLFYSLRVEEGYWWLPVLTLGKKCLGTPALRGGEFVHVLDQLLMQIRAKITAPRS